MRWIRRMALTLVVVCSMSATASAAVVCPGELINTWIKTRDAAIEELLSGWLNGASSKNLEPATLSLIRHEVLLATCTPQINIADFYLLHLPRGKVTHLPSLVLVAYLKRHGVDLSPERFFADKRFYMRGPPQRVHERVVGR